MPTKEEVYDSEISPLMQRIIATCKAAGISCLCTFDISTGEEGDEGPLMCSTYLPDGTGEMPERIEALRRELLSSGGLMAFTITKK